MSTSKLALFDVDDSVRKLQHAATCCNTLQHDATHCSREKHISTGKLALFDVDDSVRTLQHTAAHSNTLQQRHAYQQHAATETRISDTHIRHAYQHLQTDPFCFE